MKEELNHIPPESNNEQSNRKRKQKVIQLNPTYSSSVKTNTVKICSHPPTFQTFPT